MLQHTFINSFVYILFAFIVGLCCTCNNQPTRSIKTDTSTSSIPTRGIWHTGNHEKNDILQPKAPPHSQMPSIYEATYDIYRVKHNGSCGFRAFLPILLGEILVDNKWEKLLHKLTDTIYQPAMQIIKNIDLSGTRYMRISPTNNPYKLMQDTRQLLQNLNKELVARKLEEPEIQLLVKFMRQIVLMNELIGVHRQLKGNLSKVDIKEFDKLFLESCSHTEQEEFWVEGEIFKVFGIPYFLLIDQHTGAFKSFFKCFYYYLSSGNNIDAYIDIGRYEPTPEDIADLAPFLKSINPTVIMYQHGATGAFFEYLIPKKSG